jgi:hypothetical protein
VRQTIKNIGGTMPENLPAAESIKKIESKTKPKLKKKKQKNPPSGRAFLFCKNQILKKMKN